jgi:pimeloyl-ACP methyl ester carboxylesterase
METPTVPVALHHRVAGTGPPVVLLHGLGQDHSVWSAQITELAHDFKVIAPDLRGHGKTPAPPGSKFSFDEMQADVLQMLNDLAIDQVHFVGLSAGGFLTLRIGVTAPERARSLTLVSAAPHCDAHTRAVGESWAEAYREGGTDAYMLRLLKDAYYPDWIENHMDFVDRVRKKGLSADPQGIVAWGLAIGDFDLRGRLGRVRLPTLILHGMDDRIVDPSHARLLRQSIQGSQLRLFPQTGHMVPVERPQETVQAIRDFLDHVDGTNGPVSHPAAQPERA